LAGFNRQFCAMAVGTRIVASRGLGTIKQAIVPPQKRYQRRRKCGQGVVMRLAAAHITNENPSTEPAMNSGQKLLGGGETHPVRRS